MLAGAGIAHRFSLEGAAIINIDLNPPSQHAQADAKALGHDFDPRLYQDGHPSLFLSGDVTQRNTWEGALDHVNKSGWKLTAVVNNAGW